MSRCQFVAVYPPMLNHIRMGKLAGWRPRGHHERVRHSYMMNFVYYKRENRDLPCRLFGRKKDKWGHSPPDTGWMGIRTHNFFLSPAVDIGRSIFGSWLGRVAFCFLFLRVLN